MNLGSPPDICPGPPPYITIIPLPPPTPGSNGFVVDASQFQPPRLGISWSTPPPTRNGISSPAMPSPMTSACSRPTPQQHQRIHRGGGMIFTRPRFPPTRSPGNSDQRPDNTIYVKKSLAPDPLSYDLIQEGQMPRCAALSGRRHFQRRIFHRHPGCPGTAIPLDSRQQPVTAIPFKQRDQCGCGHQFPLRHLSGASASAANCLATQSHPFPRDPDIAVRRDTVPNEFRNDGVSETPPTTSAPVLPWYRRRPVPGAVFPGLSDGTFYVTILQKEHTTPTVVPSPTAIRFLRTWIMYSA